MGVGVCVCVCVCVFSCFKLFFLFCFFFTSRSSVLVLVEVPDKPSEDSFCLFAFSFSSFLPPPVCGAASSGLNPAAGASTPVPRSLALFLSAASCVARHCC